MISFYLHTKGTKPAVFRTEADKANWEAVDAVVKRHEAAGDTDVLIALEINRGDGFIKDKVDDYVALHIDTNKDAVWTAIRNVEREIAKERGLI